MYFRSVQLSKWMFLIFMLLSASLQAQHHHSSGRSAAKKKKVKFTTPTPIPPDELKEALLQNQHEFAWQFSRDTELPVSVLFREEIAFEPDSAIITQYYSKMDMHFYGKRANVHGKEGNNIYAVYRFKMPWKIYYETVSIMSYKTKQFEDYELVRETGLPTFEYLRHLKTKRKYENGMNQTESTSENAPGYHIDRKP